MLFPGARRCRYKRRCSAKLRSGSTDSSVVPNLGSSALDCRTKGSSRAVTGFVGRNAITGFLDNIYWHEDKEGYHS